MAYRKGEMTVAAIRRSHPFAIVVDRDAVNCSVSLQYAYPTMGGRRSSVMFEGREFIVFYFQDRVIAEKFRRAARGWTYTDRPTDGRPETAWPPRDAKAVLCLK